MNDGAAFEHEAVAALRRDLERAAGLAFEERLELLERVQRELDAELDRDGVQEAPGR